MSVALTGDDTIKINDRILADLADKDCGVLDPPNELASVKVGKNGNALFALNQQGNIADLVIRVVRGSADDKYLNNLLNIQKNNFSGFVLMDLDFIKKVGDGKGNIAGDTYIGSGGIFTKNVPAKNNQEGDTDQSASEYRIRFSKCIRLIA